MHEMKRGELTSGRSKKKVRNPKQAIAIGLSEARRSGAKVPKAPGRKQGGGRRSSGSLSESPRKSVRSSRSGGSGSGRSGTKQSSRSDRSSMMRE
jgi:hypothetical protein